MDRVPNKKIMCNDDTTSNNYLEQARQAAREATRDLEIWQQQRFEKEDYILRQLWPSATWCGDGWRS